MAFDPFDTASKPQFMIMWYADYLGIGYVISPEDARIFPVFNIVSKKKAEDIWIEHVEPFPDHEYVMSFVEEDKEYHFILYRKNLIHERINWFFYRGSMDIEGTYSTFKLDKPEKAYFTFGYYNNGIMELSDRLKQVTQMKFMNIDELEEGSMEKIAIETQKKIKGL